MMKPLLKLLRRLRPRGAGAKPRAGASPSHDSLFPFRIDWRKTGTVIATIAALSVLMSIHLRPDKIALNVGDISPREVRAGRSVVYFDSVATTRRQEAARREIRPVYDVEEDAASNAARTVQQLFDRIEEARKARSAQGRPDAALPPLSVRFPDLPLAFSESQIRALLAMPPAMLQKLRDVTRRRVAAAMDREIREQSEDLRTAAREVEAAAREDLASERDAALVAAVARQALRPNRLLNRRKTQEARAAAAQKIAPVYTRIQRDEKIIGPGEVVTADHVEKFIALGLANPRLELTTGFAVCALAAAMVFLVAFYIYRSLPALYADTKRLAMLSIICIFSIFGLKVGATLLGVSFSSGQLGFLGMMGVTAAGMLVSVLLDMHLAVLIVALLAAQSGLIMNHEIRFTIMTLLSGLVGIVSAGSVRYKINLPRATGALAAANLGLVWLLGLLFHDTQQEMLTGSAWAIASAGFATFLFWFGVQALEKPFGILTHSTLMELSGFDRPLLKQLCAVAPGTYAHSVMVGTLAEAGAQAIGADALLCRVSGYYHDIGKMKRPEFFVENQRRENVHGRLSPSLSALIITAHVRDGVEMAREHKLPMAIRDIIAQHHGTSLIRYFYHRALMDNDTGEETPPGFEERFRYPGPKPQTREAAVVMLADTIEAAARCLDKPTKERLEDLINTLTREKIEDGQFDECRMTFPDARQVCDAFLHVMTAMMHGRIDYPKMPRTASGQPMEVVRPDLRPESPEMPLASPPGLARDDVPAAYLPREARLDADVTREIAAHLEQQESAPGDAGALRAASREAVTGTPLPRSLVEPEVLYGRIADERAEPPRPNDYAAPGSPPPAQSGGDEPRGSQYPADR